ncbi:hypothetical protein [Cryobacterium gelidum]|uniref:Flagellar protein FlgN n=1 Tax=Cryobacterium gelidum TaxID=1259164 RepID=A0A4R9AT19_9MICO|nr:hypothetical protein [Cryobacterium gelidum]TFD68336.1 hypothetical protein E3T50_14440 [Cryobacterium gelidum]
MAKTATTDAATRAAWAGALDALELSLDTAARSMGPAGAGGAPEPLTAWTPPVALGLLPVDFAERAQDLLTNQQKLIGQLEQARSLTRKHLTAVRSVPPERDARASVYLDVNG